MVTSTTPEMAYSATMNAGVRTIAVMFDRDLITDPGDRARILGVSPLIREMMLYALRWPIDRAHSDEVADTYFRAFGSVVADTLADEAPLTLPTSDDPVVAAAMAYTKDHLQSVGVDAAAAAAAVSTRTLRRMFQDSVGMSWRTYLLQARMLRAMALLAGVDETVQSVATQVGFASVSAFARAFANFSGESPSSYRARVVQ